MKTKILLLIALFSAFFTQQAGAVNYIFKRIDVPGSFFTHVDSINAKGQVAGAFGVHNSDGEDIGHGFVYKNGKFKIFDIKNAPSPKVDIQASSINNNGVVVGFHSTAVKDDYHSFIYGGGKYATSFDFPGFVGSEAYGISAKGEIAGTYFLSFHNRRAYILTGGKFTSLDVPGLDKNRRDFIQDIVMNERGTVVGSYSSGYSFIYKKGRIFKLNFPGVIYARPRSINARNQIIGSYLINDAYSGFLYSKGQLKKINIPGATDVIPRDINNCGQIIGQYSDAAENEYSFLYRGGRSQIIKVPGSVKTIISGINDKGQLIGSYEDSSSHSHAFIATPMHRH